MWNVCAMLHRQLQSLHIINHFTCTINHIVNATKRGIHLQIICIQSTIGLKYVKINWKKIFGIHKVHKRDINSNSNIIYVSEKSRDIHAEKNSQGCIFAINIIVWSGDVIHGYQNRERVRGWDKWLLWSEIRISREWLNAVISTRMRSTRLM